MEWIKLVLWGYTVLLLQLIFNLVMFPLVSLFVQLTNHYLIRSPHHSPLQLHYLAHSSHHSPLQLHYLILTPSISTVGMKDTLGLRLLVISPMCLRILLPLYESTHVATPLHTSPNFSTHCNKGKVDYSRAGLVMVYLSVCLLLRKNTLLGWLWQKSSFISALSHPQPTDPQDVNTTLHPHL